VTNGGGGAIIFPHSDPVEVRAPAGSLCSSTRAELIAIRDAAMHVASLDTADTNLPITICLDSKPPRLLNWVPTSGASCSSSISEATLSTYNGSRYIAVYKATNAPMY